jgi:autotransporter-associated beta strand protein
LPASSKVSTDNILLAQARKGNNGNGQGGGTCNNDNNNQNQSGQDCGDLNSGVSGAAEEPTGQPIVNADQVDVYELPDEYKVILPAKDGKTFFGISYSMWSKPGDYPGISYGQWYQESKKTGKFFPWRGNPELAQNLSSNYKIYAQSRLRDKLNEDGDILLYGYDNGGGFVYGDFNKGQSPEGSLNRPDVTESGNSQGLLYFHNGVSHFTVGVQGGGGRIQAFGGCEVNTISKDKNVSTSRILPKDDLCRWDGNQVSSDYYVPLLDGGELFADKSKGSNIELSNQLFVTDKGGTIDNNGVNLILEGSIQSIGDISDAPSPLFFEGPKSTSLQGNNSYLNPTTVKEGVLEITNVDGLGSADAGTRVEERAVLRITVDGRPTPQGSTSNDAKINEEITLAGGELYLNGNYIDLKKGVVLEGEGTNSTIRVKKGSTEVFARSTISGDGGLIKDGEGFLRLGGGKPQTYEGETIIEAGELRFAETTSTPETTDVTVTKGATLRLMGGPGTAGGLNTVGSIQGKGRIVLNEDKAHLSVNVPSSKKNHEFEGSILGGPGANALQGTFIKDGDGKLTLSGKNAYGSLMVEGGQLDINGENIDKRRTGHNQASVSLSLGNDLSVKGGSALRVTGRDVDPTFGPRTPGEGEDPSFEGTISKIAQHASPIIEFDDSINELTVENGSLLVASFIGALPTDYEAYKDNCKIGADPKTCYSIRPQISFKGGDDTLTNNGLIVGPGEGRYWESFAAPFSRW